MAYHSNSFAMMGAPACVLSLHVRNLPLYDYREALRPPTRCVPLEEEEYEEEG